MFRLLLSLLVFGAGAAHAATCSIRGSTAGFAVYNDAKLVAQYPSLFDANALKTSLLAQHVCEAAPIKETCTIKPAPTKFDVLQGEALVSSYWFVDDAAILRDVMAEDGMCTVPAPTVACSVTTSTMGFDVAIGQTFVATKTTLKEADDLATALITAKVCL